MKEFKKRELTDCETEGLDMLCDYTKLKTFGTSSHVYNMKHVHRESKIADFRKYVFVNNKLFAIA